MNGKKIVPQVVGMAVASIVVWGINAWSGVLVPAEIAVAFGTLASVGVALATPDDKEGE